MWHAMRGASSHTLLPSLITPGVGPGGYVCPPLLPLLLAPLPGRQPKAEPRQGRTRLGTSVKDEKKKKKKKKLQKADGDPRGSEEGLGEVNRRQGLGVQVRSDYAVPRPGRKPRIEGWWANFECAVSG